MCITPILSSPTVETIIELCFEKYRTLPKTGKPTPDQWTVLAGIVQYDHNTNNNKVVAIGCGTKCIGQSKLCERGLILNDSHAEVLARRGFLRYLQNEVKKATNPKEQSIFEWHDTSSSYQLNKNITFHFLSTQTPCGDACIITEENKDEIPTKRARLDTEVSAEDSNNLIGCLLQEPTTNENVYTGAKLIDTQLADAMEQTIGALRTKPGRGDRTLSMSCSDKLARWHMLGVQGAFLDMLLEQPIYCSTLNFCCADGNQKSLERAIFKRWHNRDFKSIRFKPKIVDIRISEALKFENAQNPNRQPSPNGLVWADLPDSMKPYEVSVSGKRQGITKNKLNTQQAALAVSKYKLFTNFCNLLRDNPVLLNKFNLSEMQLDQLTYRECKLLAIEYQLAWIKLKKYYFRQWTHKPVKYLNFNLEDISCP